MYFGACVYAVNAMPTQSHSIVARNLYPGVCMHFSVAISMCDHNHLKTYEDKHRETWVDSRVYWRCRGPLNDRILTRVYSKVNHAWFSNCGIPRRFHSHITSYKTLLISQPTIKGNASVAVVVVTQADRLLCKLTRHRSAAVHKRRKMVYLSWDTPLWEWIRAALNSEHYTSLWSCSVEQLVDVF